MPETDQRNADQGAQTAKKRRKSADERVSDIIEAAADHFAEAGFSGGTREIAKRLGVTQPLLYRYFPDKDSLIEAVYRTVYLESWDPNWDVALLDRSKSVRSRYTDFYRAYTAANFNSRWLRISYMAGLRDAEINEWYNHLVEELILKRLVQEYRVEIGLPDGPFVEPEELSLAWQMHGGLLHFGWRRHVLNLTDNDDIEQVITDALDMYFAVAAQYYEAKAVKKPDTC